MCRIVVTKCAGFNSLIGYMVDMAKLADAVDCGSTVRDHVRVQVPLFTLITAVIRTDTEVGLSSRSHGFNSRTVDQIQGSANLNNNIGMSETGTFDIPTCGYRIISEYTSLPNWRGRGGTDYPF